jgi:outer membrane protein TolC
MRCWVRFMLRAIVPTVTGSIAVVLIAAILSLASCAAPAELPLPSQAVLSDSLDGLNHDGMLLQPKLTVSQVALLAVRNNPDLRATRSQHGVAQAQVLQTGLMPNPQFTGAFLPLVAGLGTTPAYNAGLSEDIRALIVLSSSRAAAWASAGQVDAQVLWQEWQVIGQARLLAVDVITADRLMALLARNRDLLATRYRKSQIAVAAGNETLAVLAPDLAALQTTTAQINDLERQQLSRRHQLNALLGLAPDVAVPLDPRIDIPPWNVNAVAQALPTFAQRRPDLVALQFGYRAQSAKLRTAILSRFPNLVFGMTGGSDNSNVRNLGPQVTLELPIFNQNQGHIAIEMATRQQLHDEYAARLAAASGQVRAMTAEIGLLSHQLITVRQDLAGTRRVAGQAEAAFNAGNLDERSYVDLVAARLTKEQEIVTIEQSLLDQQVAVATLIGAGMPAIAIPSGETPE